MKRRYFVKRIFGGAAAALAAGCETLPGEAGGAGDATIGRDITVNGVEVTTADASFEDGAAEISGALAGDLDSALQAGLFNRLNEAAQYRMLVDVRRVSIGADGAGSMAGEVRYLGPDGESILTRSVSAATTAGYDGLLIEFATAVRTRA